MDYKEFVGSSVDDAITTASVEFGVTSDRLDYEVLEEGSSGFFGIGSKDAKIRARVKSENEAIEKEEPAAKEESAKEDISVPADTDSAALEAREDYSEEAVDESAEVSDEKSVDHSVERRPVDVNAAKDAANTFLKDLFGAMELDVTIEMHYDEENNSLNIELSGPEMGIIIGKRGATLDSVQYLANLAINRKLESYVRVKIDTEDYRYRRKQTLENLAKNVAYKVKRTRRPVSLEAMNPYERRIIHYALQSDNYVTTHSEGEEPYRHIVVVPK